MKSFLRRFLMSELIIIDDFKYITVGITVYEICT